MSLFLGDTCWNILGWSICHFSTVRERETEIKQMWPRVNNRLLVVQIKGSWFLAGLQMWAWNPDLADNRITFPWPKWSALDSRTGTRAVRMGQTFTSPMNVEEMEVFRWRRKLQVGSCMSRNSCLSWISLCWAWNFGKYKPVWSGRRKMAACLCMACGGGRNWVCTWLYRGHKLKVTQCVYMIPCIFPPFINSEPLSLV